MTEIQVGSFITKLVYTLEYLSPLLPSFLRPDFHAEARSLSLHDLSFMQFFRSLVAPRPPSRVDGMIDWAQSKDATPYDCTFEAAAERDEQFWDSMPVGGESWANAGSVRLKSKGQTWYRSYAASMTVRKRVGDGEEVPEYAITVRPQHHEPSDWTQVFDAGPLYFSASSLGVFDYASIQPPPVFLAPYPAFIPLPPQSAMPHRDVDRERHLEEARVRTRARAGRSHRHSSYRDSLGSETHSPTLTPLSTLSLLPSIPDSPTSPLSSLLSPTDTRGLSASAPTHASRAYADSEIPQTPLPPISEPLDLTALPEAYFANDGVVPVFSQWHPGACWPGVRCIHQQRENTTAGAQGSISDIALHVHAEDDDFSDEVLRPPLEPPRPIDFNDNRLSGIDSNRLVEESTARQVEQPVQFQTAEADRQLPEPGIFYVYDLPVSTASSKSSVDRRHPENNDTAFRTASDGSSSPLDQGRHHHLSIMPLWTGTDRQRAFWREVGSWLEDVDDARATMLLTEI